jgi:agmatinase
MQRARPVITFLHADYAADPSLTEADFAFLGVPYGSPYTMRGVHGSAGDAPDAVRRAAHEFEYHTELDHWDFDCDGPLLPADVRVVDCGDAPGDPRDMEWGKREATLLVRRVVEAGALPLIVGGDDAIPPIVAAGLGADMHVLHIDAHVDYRDELFGVRDGYSSPIRRLRELPNVHEIVQVGLRGVGSGRAAEVEAAIADGNRLVTARELHERGAPAVFAELPDDRPWFVTIDCDGLDPAVAPGVDWPEPDGITYGEAATFVRGLAKQGRIAAIEFTEYVPHLDVRFLTGLAVGRLLMNVISLSPHRNARRRAMPDTLATADAQPAT